MNAPIPRLLVSVLLILADDAVAASAPWYTLAKKPTEWYGGAEGIRVTTNILSWQSSHGLWPKNTDTTEKPNPISAKEIKGTFDNGATVEEMRFLARVFRATRNPVCETAFLRGLDGILAAQYPTGGWPQFYPPGPQYHRHVTFNDGAMVRMLGLLREVVTSPDYSFLPEAKRRAGQSAFDRGVACILKCQVVVNGQPTVWCAQHDEKDLSPRPARAYELVSLSGSESTGVLAFLMSLDAPTPEVKRAVQGGAAWFEAAKLTGIRVEKQGGDKVVVSDPAAPPLWARFYEIASNRPFFCGRDGVKKNRLADIEAERRNGYAWYGNWGESVARQYAAWSAKWLGPKSK
jgi:pectate lyase